MKLHVNTEDKTVAIEGQAQVATVFNYLISWFPEDWEQWKFIPYVETIKYKEIIVEKEVYRNPYWNPWNKPYYGTLAAPINSLSVSPKDSILTKATINFNNP